MYLKIFTLLFSLVFGGQLLTAQKLSFEHLSVKDGLAQNTVQSIVKDKYGFMWFGTWNGLCRYDGYKFKVYTNIPGDTTSLTNNRIHHIYKDPAGTLWITTFNYFVCRYNDQTDNFTRFKPAQISKALYDSTNRRQNVSAFKILADDLRRQIGPFQFAPTKEHLVFQTTPNYQGGLNDNHVYSITEDELGNIWPVRQTGFAA